MNTMATDKHTLDDSLHRPVQGEAAPCLRSHYSSLASRSYNTWVLLWVFLVSCSGEPTRCSDAEVDLLRLSVQVHRRPFMSFQPTQVGVRIGAASMIEAGAGVLSGDVLMAVNGKAVQNTAAYDVHGRLHLISNSSVCDRSHCRSRSCLKGIHHAKELVAAEVLPMKLHLLRVQNAPLDTTCPNSVASRTETGRLDSHGDVEAHANVALLISGHISRFLYQDSG